MQLNYTNIDQISGGNLAKPSKETLGFKEKVLQFGTGVLLRGLPDYYIDKANKSNIFNGRILVVKSTSTGNTDAFDEQNGLYTICIQGIDDGKIVQENIITSCISRVVNAATEWEQILDAVSNDNIQIIISNTTEAGIQESNDNIHDNPPSSFPGKLLAVLVRRYNACNGDSSKGFIILPTELISDNGKKLKEIVLKLAKQNSLPNDCIAWIENANHFCNTLVDRIVPGAYTNKELSYEDKLMIMAEPFSLWAIEAKDNIIADKLSFATIDQGIILTPSIEKFKEIKLRLLNGSHSSTCALAILGGFRTVKEAMSNPIFFQYIQSLLLDEIGASILSEDITNKDITDFSAKVLDRFSNPFLEHQWTSIAVNYTEKFKLRCIPILEKYYNKHQAFPEKLVLGFAAYILLLVSNDQISDKWKTTLQEKWSNDSDPITTILSNTAIWEKDLSQYTGLVDKVKNYIKQLSNNETVQVMENTNAAATKFD